MYRGTYLVHRDQRAPNGTRDWQNKDGTWTEAGKARRRAMYKALKDTSSDLGEPIKTVKSALGSEKHYTSREDYSDISDDELQKRVKRLNMEKSYYDLTKKEVKTGEDKAKEILDSTFKVVSVISLVAGTALTIAKVADAIAKKQPGTAVSA